MSTTLSGSVTAKVSWTYENVLDWANAQNASSFSYSRSYSNGVAINNADKLYLAQTTLAASTNLDLDLAGTLVDIYGNTITFARIKTIFFHLTTDTASTGVWIGGEGTNPFANWISGTGTFATITPKVKVRNGGVFLLNAPDATAYAVTAGTGDILRITNADATYVATYKLAIVGASS